MKELLNRLTGYESITREEAKQTLVNMAEGIYSPCEMAAFLTVYMMRSITIEELEGFRDALQELCLRVDLSAYEPIDLCGTGGDGKDTFNISTLASFVAAGAGLKVAKHGNYGLSSTCGSSNVLEFLGIPFTNEREKLEKAIDKAGICILHAPLFHPAMKNVAPVRKELKVKTFFNMLGPLVNPAFPKNQLVGVFNLELARMYNYLYQNDSKNYVIVHALDGYDEISLTETTRVISNNSEGILKPEDFGVATVTREQISGGSSIRHAADIFMNVLDGKGTKAQNDVVCANAGMAIACVKKTTPEEGFRMAEEALYSKKAKKSFKTLLNI